MSCCLPCAGGASAPRTEGQQPAPVALQPRAHLELRVEPSRLRAGSGQLPPELYLADVERDDDEDYEEEDEEDEEAVDEEYARARDDSGPSGQHRLSPRLHDIEEEDDEDPRAQRER